MAAAARVDFLEHRIQRSPRYDGHVSPGLVPPAGREWQPDLAEGVDRLVSGVSVM